MTPRTWSMPSRIHAIAAMIPLDDAEYRSMLYDLYGKRSSKELTELQQTEFAKILQKQIKPKRANPVMATGKQLGAVRAMWANVSRAETSEARERALLKFCKRITGSDFLQWLRKADVRKLIKAMEKMGAASPERFKAMKFQSIQKVQPINPGDFKVQIT